MNRREMLKLGIEGTFVGSGLHAAESLGELPRTSHDSVAKWEVFELRLEGPSKGNPFIDVSVTAQFSLGHRMVSVDGFYDGAGVYKVNCV